MTSPANNFYEFGPFTLDASERTLRRGEEHVHLTPKEFDTLLVLVRGGGRVMSEGELLKEIWPDTFVEEATLAQNVFTLRMALARGDEGESQQYIETVPRRGYRFAAKVRETNKTDGTTFATEAEAQAGGEAARLSSTLQVASIPPAETFQPALPSSTPAPHSATAAGNVDGGSAHKIRGREKAGRPVLAAILITLGAVVAFGALVYAVLRFSVRPETSAPRPPMIRRERGR